MSPEQYEIREKLKQLANPDGSRASWAKRTQVENYANSAVLEGQCRNSELGCALCDMSGVTCTQVNGLLAPLKETLEIL